MVEFCLQTSKRLPEASQNRPEIYYVIYDKFLRLYVTRDKFLRHQELYFTLTL